MTRRWRQDATTGKLVEITAPAQSGDGFYINGPFEPLVSPIDGSRIRNRQQLVEHNRRHGVTNDLDSLREKSQRSLNKTPYTGTKAERTAAIVDAIERTQSSGYSRN